jgi:hypothetical protein
MAVGVAVPLVVASCADQTPAGVEERASMTLEEKADLLLSQRQASAAASSALASTSISYIAQLCDGHGYEGMANHQVVFDASLWDYYYFDATAGDLVTIEVHRTSSAMDAAMTLFFGTTDNSEGLEFYQSTQPGMQFIHYWDDDIDPVHLPPPADPGDWRDPQMLNYTMPETGRYTLGVYDAFGRGPGPQVPYDILVEGLGCGCDISLVVEPTSLWPPDHKMHLVADDVSTEGSCGGSELGVTVTSNEHPNGHGDGNTEQDWEVVDNGDGTYDVWVRAERSGKGDGRVYTITATLTDAAGNVTAESSGTVTVPHDKGKRNK